ncbi:GNAT family N-acetyltransferase [Rheinheimera sp. WS51]|uniref:GNAT family N-acetyltransferase n=1 Tax=Rheinheimera sp. WS51 TaxID=3425886 RepID=UPI003D9329D1
MPAIIKSIESADLSSVIQIQDSCYGDALYEAPELLAQRISTQPASCWVITRPDNTVQAYLLSYPAKQGFIAALGSPFKQGVQADLLYLHDLAVAPYARKQGLANKLLEHAEQFATDSGFDKLALVAVQGAQSYWQTKGFQTIERLSPEAAEALQTYADKDAIYMIKTI